MSTPKERELDDDYPIYADYYYVVDGKVYLSDHHGISARELKRRLKATSVTNCDIYGRGGFQNCALAVSSKER
ncbi:MAG TPA: hypothetical protein VLC51_10030 [Nitrospira sp.]|nr:hypothetical protein [Nitrospira sp.]